MAARPANSYLSPHRRMQSQMRRYAVWSLVAHVVLLVIASFSLNKVNKVPPPAALQVKLVGVPQPKPQSKPIKEEKVRTQDSPAPKEPPPVPKDLPQQDTQSKFATEKVKEVAETSKTQLVKADERPPVLDKTPREKKVVKNEKDAKVVKDPEEFLKTLDFIDKLEEKPSPAKSEPKAKPSKEKAGEGKQLNLNLSEQGAVDGIRAAIQKNWTTSPGLDTSELTVGVEVQVDESGNVTSVRVSESSGNNSFDQSLVRAVRKSSPLPLPPGSYEKFQTLDLQFSGASQ